MNAEYRKQLLSLMARIENTHWQGHHFYVAWDCRCPKRLVIKAVNSWCYINLLPFSECCKLVQAVEVEYALAKLGL